MDSPFLKHVKLPSPQCEARVREPVLQISKFKALLYPSIRVKSSRMQHTVQ